MIKKLKYISIALVTLFTITFVLTSQVGTVVNSKQVQFKDGTGFYSAKANYKGKKEIIPFIKLMDIFVYKIKL